MLMRSLTLLALAAAGVIAQQNDQAYQYVKRDSFQAAPNGTAGTATDAAATYDYIVVGSGAGGGTLAARLATYGFQVLLIEAGDDQGANRNEQIPSFHAYSTEDPAMAWNFFVDHYQNETQQVRDSKMAYRTPAGETYVGLTPPAGSTKLGILYPRAGTLGGCSAHNALVAIYPHASDWNNIAQITGDQSWSAYNMRQYFERLENCEYCPPIAVGHGKTGWLGIDRADLTLALPDAKILALATSSAKALGEKITGAISGTVANLLKVVAYDLNSAEPGRDQRQGLYQIPIHSRKNVRNSAREFVLYVANAKTPFGTRAYRLDVRLNTLVTRVLWNNTASGPGIGPRATGVEVLVGKSQYRADPRAGTAPTGQLGAFYARKEVILAGGAYNTPQLLKLSGVGPREELTRFGINVVADRPGVGNNLQDHFEIGVVDQAGSDFEVVKDCTFGQTGDPCVTRWQQGTGPYQSNGFYLAMVKKSSVSYGDPDLLMFGGTATFRGYYPGYSRDVYGRRNFTWAVLKAHSRNNAASVNLRSADPRDVPHIQWNYFETGAEGGKPGAVDLQALYEGANLGRETFPKSGVPDNFTEKLPGIEIQGEQSMKQYIRDEAWGHHASCSAPIGADNDPMAVLDSQFRVRGVRGLRVVDASAFPRIPGFFIVVPTYMLGEKAADVIAAAGRAGRI